MASFSRRAFFFAKSESRVACRPVRDFFILATLLVAASRREAGDPELHHFLGLTLLRLERPEEALTELESAVAIAPGLLAAREDLGLLLALSGRPAEALRQLEAAAGLGKPSAELHYRTGLALMGLRRWREAASHLESALEKDASHVEARRSLAEVRRRL